MRKNDTNVSQAVPSSRVEDTSQVGDVSAASGILVDKIEIDRGVRSWSVAEYKTRYGDTLDTLWFGAIFFGRCQLVHVWPSELSL